MVGALALRRLGSRLLAPRMDISLTGLPPQLRGLASAAGSSDDEAAAGSGGGGGQPSSSISPSAMDAANASLKTWKARAAKEAKGRDPWAAFSSKSTDVSGRPLEGGLVCTAAARGSGWRALQACAGCELLAALEALAVAAAGR